MSFNKVDYLKIIFSFVTTFSFSVTGAMEPKDRYRHVYDFFDALDRGDNESALRCLGCRRKYYLQAGKLHHIDFPFVRSIDCVGKTALVHAFNRKNYPLFEKLLSLGADINHHGPAAITMLENAIIDEQSDNVEYLVDHGADVNYSAERHSSALKHSPLDLAVAHYRHLIDELLTSGNFDKANSLRRIIRYLVFHGALGSDMTMGSIYYYSRIPGTIEQWTTTIPPALFSQLALRVIRREQIVFTKVLEDCEDLVEAAKIALAYNQNDLAFKLITRVWHAIKRVNKHPKLNELYKHSCTMKNNPVRQWLEQLGAQMPVEIRVDDVTFEILREPSSLL